MIKLNSPYVTSVVSTMGSESKTIVTDTLFISHVRLDLTTGALYATVQRGTGNPFVANMTPLEVCVNPDGSFVSSDGSWSGSVASAPALVSELAQEFDQFILGSGEITGTVIADGVGYSGS
jgi:hypothetical protein